MGFCPPWPTDGVVTVLDTIRLSEQQKLIREGIREICADYDESYWRRKDANAEFPTEFVDTLAEEGWLGALVPEAYGGPGLTTSEVVVMMEEIGRTGGFAAAQAIHGGIYNVPPIVNYGSEALKSELLPELASGDSSVQSLALTEPNAGSDSTAIETTAERDGDEYVIDGGKIWISRVDRTDYMVVMARTTPRSAVDRRTEGISMFLVDVGAALDAGTLEMEPIPKTAARCVHSFELWFEGLRVPADRLIGEEGEGFYQLLDGLNEERVVIAAECIGLGAAALSAGVEYAGEREVFGGPIGANQAIQHPLADAYARVRAARELVHGAADRLHDTPKQEAGVGANAAKYLASEAAFTAADAAVQTHGGFGVAREYDVERYLREARLTRLVPITQQLALNYIGTTALGLPKSY